MELLNKREPSKKIVLDAVKTVSKKFRCRYAKLVHLSGILQKYDDNKVGALLVSLQLEEKLKVRKSVYGVSYALTKTGEDYLRIQRKIKKAAKGKPVDVLNICNFRPNTTSSMKDFDDKQPDKWVLRSEPKTAKDVAAYAIDAAIDAVERAVDPEHYKTNLYGKELIDVMVDQFGLTQVMHYCKLNAFKYRNRAGRKEGQSIEQDIKKAIWYEDRLAKLRKDYDDLPF